MDNTLQLPTPLIPRAFVGHRKIMQVLCATVDEFSHEEQQALYYHHYIGLDLPAIARTVLLTENHVRSTLNLYAERLTAKLELFKKAMSYNENDTLHVRDILLPWSA